MLTSPSHLSVLPEHAVPILGDPLGRRCLITSAALHGSALIVILGWHIITSWFSFTPDQAAKPEVTSTTTMEIIYHPTPSGDLEESHLPALPEAIGDDQLSDPLRPRLDHSHQTGSGNGQQRDHGLAIDLPELPAQQALPQVSAQHASEGGGRRSLPQQLRREQEANYFLMGFLLRQYQREWKPIFGHRLARGPIRLWIEHDNSRVISAQFARGSSTGIDELDRRILAWLVADNKIDLSDLRGSDRRLLMSVDLYQAHR